MATAHDELHALVDRLPPSRAADAVRLLRALIAAALVPEDDEPETDEERSSVERAKRDIAEGKGESWETVRARLLGGT